MRRETKPRVWSLKQLWGLKRIKRGQRFRVIDHPDGYNRQWTGKVIEVKAVHADWFEALAEGSSVCDPWWMNGDKEAPLWNDYDPDTLVERLHGDRTVLRKKLFSGHACAECGGIMEYWQENIPTGTCFLCAQKKICLN